MPDLGPTLEREMERIPVAPYSIEAVARRRDRRRRSRRGGAILVAVSVVAAPIWWLARSPSPTAERQPVAPGSIGRIAFISGVGDTGDRLYSVKPDGSDLVDVTTTHAEYPDWSPEGDLIAFDDGRHLAGSALPLPNGSIYTVRPDGSGLERIPHRGEASAPSWSPDGDRLAVATRQAGRDPGIAWLDVSSGEMTSVTTNPYEGYWDAEPDVTPDGSRIAFIRVRELVDRGGDRNRAAVFIVNADGTGLRRLTDWRIDAGTPAWSPDGSRIAFSTQDHALVSRTAEIVVIAPDGTELVRLGSRSGDDWFWPTWSPDGSTIVFTQAVAGVGLVPTELMRVPATGGEATRLGGRTPQGNQADWGLTP